MAETLNSAWILLSAAGVMIEVIVAMIVYITVIEKKYTVENKNMLKLSRYISGAFLVGNGELEI